MKLQNTLVLALLVIGAAGCARETQPVAAKNPENSAVNERDRGGANKTPMDQGQSTPDVKVTASIRQRLQKENVSTDAKNAKIITHDGMVTLRGPVKSSEEKDLLEKIAKDVAGDAKVENLLEVAAKP